jgi:hypothetical protein
MQLYFKLQIQKQYYSDNGTVEKTTVLLSHKVITPLFNLYVAISDAPILKFTDIPITDIEEGPIFCRYRYSMSSHKIQRHHDSSTLILLNLIQFNSFVSKYWKYQVKCCKCMHSLSRHAWSGNSSNLQSGPIVSWDFMLSRTLHSAHPLF